METLSTILVFDSKETSTCSPIVKKKIVVTVYYVVFFSKCP